MATFSCRRENNRLGLRTILNSEKFSYSSFKAGVCSQEYKDPPLVEVFICVGKQRVPVSEANRILGVVFDAYTTGDTKDLERVFYEKTGRSFHEFTSFLDQSIPRTRKIAKVKNKI